MAGDELRGRGWYLTDAGIQQCTENGKSDINSLIKVALDTDLKEIGKGWLPEEVGRGRADYVEGPGILQLQKIRNVSAPKDHEESQAAPRLLKLVLTDGQITCNAIETETLREIGLNTAPGSKIKLKITTDVEHGFLLLNNKNTQYLGGRVEKMAESWELKKKLAKQPRASQAEGGPPLFVPFGKRIGDAQYRQANKRDNFRSLGVEEKKEKKAEDGEFEQQRKATIAEALQAKEDGKTKTFGGGQKQIATDHSIARITEMGFTAEEASSALRIKNGNVQQALDYLLNNKRPKSFTTGPNRQSSYEKRDLDKGRGRRGRDGEDEGPATGRGRRGRENDDIDEASSRPSGPATLFDFLETKMPAKEEKNKAPTEKKESKPPPLEVSSQKMSSSTSSSSSQHSSQGQGHNHSQGQGRQRSSNQHQESWAHGQSNRRQQNIPPRFVNKAKYDEQSQGQGRYRDDRPRTAPSDSRNYSDRRNYNTNNSADDRTSYQNRRQADDNQRNNYNRNNNASSRTNDSRSQGRSDRQDYQKSRNDQRSGYNKENQSRDQYRGGNSSNQSRNSQQNNSNKRDNYSQQNNQSGQNRKQQNSQQSYQQQSYRNDQRSQGKMDSYGDELPRQQNYQAPPAERQMNTVVTTYQPQNEFVYTGESTPMQLKRGDHVMAKYWEDGLFYEAVIEVLAPNLPTCVVTFLEYGNSEEVLLSDISRVPPTMIDPRTQQPMAVPQQPNLAVPPPQVFYTAGPPPPQMSPIEESMGQINSMEFRRGGGGAAYTRKRDDGRPPQQLYQPPPQRR